MKEEELIYIEGMDGDNKEKEELKITFENFADDPNFDITNMASEGEDEGESGGDTDKESNNDVDKEYTYVPGLAEHATKLIQEKEVNNSLSTHS